MSVLSLVEKISCCAFWFAIRPEGSIEVEDDKIKSFIASNSDCTTRKVAKTLTTIPKDFHFHLETLGYVSKFHIAATCNWKLKKRPFLKRLTGEVDCLWNTNGLGHDLNLLRTSKAQLHQRKIKLSVWWNWKGRPIYSQENCRKSDLNKVQKIRNDFSSTYYVL